MMSSCTLSIATGRHEMKAGRRPTVTNCNIQPQQTRAYKLGPRSYSSQKRHLLTTLVSKSERGIYPMHPCRMGSRSALGVICNFPRKPRFVRKHCRKRLSSVIDAIGLQDSSITFIYYIRGPYCPARFSYIVVIACMKRVERNK